MAEPTAQDRKDLHRELLEAAENHEAYASYCASRGSERAMHAAEAVERAARIRELIAIFCGES